VVPQRDALTKLGLIALLVLSWGSTFAAVKIGLDSAPPLVYAGLRSMVGGAVIGAVALARSDPPEIRRNGPVYALLALLNVVLFFGLQTVAIGDLPSGLAAVLIYLQPVLVGLLARPMLGERLSGTKLIGLLLGFSGIIAVSAGAFEGSASTAGIGYAVTAALTWALGTIAFKKVHERVPALWAVAIPFMAGGVVLTVAGLLLESGGVTWSGQFVAALAYSALIGTALSWFLWFGLIASGEASRAAAYIFFVPLVSLVVGAAVLDEPLTFSLLIGAGLVAVGIYLVNRRQVTKAPPALLDP
jgi:drug/metabolite transporter (DMT)-like permease